MLFLRRFFDALSQEQSNPENPNPPDVFQNFELHLIKVKVLSDKDYFTLIKAFRNSGEVWRHSAVDVTSSDYSFVQEVAIDKAFHGSEVYILPDGNFDPKSRDDLFEGAKGSRCPDLKVDGVYIEIKEPTLPLTYSKISDVIKRGYEQANHIILNLIEPCCSTILWRATKGRFKTHADLQIVEFKMNGKYHRFDRHRILRA